MLSFIIIAVLSLIGPLLMWRVLFPVPRRPLDAVPDSFLSIIIPARNEERNVGTLLASIARQEVAPHELLVVDDNSSDATACVAREGGATVLAGRPLPAGWNGKQWACWQGAQAATGQLLLFLDADTWFQCQGLRALLHLYDEYEGLLSMQPYHVPGRPYEQLSAFFNIISMAATNAFTPLGERLAPGGAFGPCMLCRREDYFRIGGHRAVKTELMDDISLAKEFLRHGLPVRCYAGASTLSFRMYPGGPSELLEGWSRGFGYGAASVRLPFALLSVAWICGCFGISAALTQALLAPPGPRLWLTLLLYGLYVVQIHAILRGVGRFRWWIPVLFPIPLTFFALVVARSFVMTYVLGQVRWKGRVLGRRAPREEAQREDHPSP